MVAVPILDSRSLQWTILSLLLLLAIAGCESKKEADPRFTAGRQALMRGDYKPAIEKLEGYLQAKPQGGLASRTSFLIAKAQLGLGDNDAARKQFELTIQKFQTSEEAHKSQYKLAMLSLIEGDSVDARNRFQSLVDKPSGTLVPEATAMLRFLEKQAAAANGGDEPPPEGSE